MFSCASVGNVILICHYLPIPKLYYWFPICTSGQCLLYLDMMQKLILLRRSVSEPCHFFVCFANTRNLYQQSSLYFPNFHVHECEDISSFQNNMQMHISVSFTIKKKFCSSTGVLSKSEQWQVLGSGRDLVTELLEKSH